MLDRPLAEGAEAVTARAARPGHASIRERAEDGVRWLVVALGCSIPISVAIDNVLLTVILACWVLGGGYREKFTAIRGNPVAIATLALAALYLVGTLYTMGNWHDVLNSLSKASRLLLIPALMPLMRDDRWRRRGVAAFQASMVVTLVLSCLLWLGAISANDWIKGTESDPAVFKAHITHNVFMAFVAYIFALAALEMTSQRARILCWALCALAIANVLVMVAGRTGHIVLLVLFTYFLYRRFRARGVAVAAVALGALAVAVALSPDTMLYKRITLADDELQQWRAGVPPDTTSSVGQRLEFVRNTLSVIRDNPVLGVGTGGFGAAYTALAARTGDAPTNNPHNEFLMIVAQFGLAGLALALALFGTQWWLAGRLAGRFEQAAARGFVLTVVVASLLSSTLVDHTEGIFFAYMSGLFFAGYNGPGFGRRTRGAAAERSVVEAGTTASAARRMH